MKLFTFVSIENYGAGFFRFGVNGPGINWTKNPPFFSERNGYRKPFMRLNGYRYFWLKSL